MPSFSSKRSYNFTAPQIDIITYCVNQHLKEFSPEEDNEARKLMEEFAKGGMATSSILPQLPMKEDPYANYCDI